MPMNTLTDTELEELIDLDRLCRHMTADKDPDLAISSVQDAFQEQHLPGTGTDGASETQRPEPRRPQKQTASSPSPRETVRNMTIPEFSVVCFPSNPSKPEGIKKKRRDFAEKRRLEVALVRKTGACFRCKMRRISVSLPAREVCISELS